jgi:phosphate uptake regulator
LTELERLGDRVVNLREVPASGDAHDPLPSYAEVLQIGNLATAMARDAMEAFSRSDVSLVKPVLEKDKEFDALYSHVFPNLITPVAKNRSRMTQDAKLILLSKDLKEISEHTTTMGAVAMFLASGKGIIHMDIRERRAGTDRPREHNGQTNIR